jgi:DNA-binding PadR family transcriptional regulator
MEGRYAPSPGIVYPTLQMLEDEGYVSTSEQDGRRVYSLTENGQQYAIAQHTLIEDAWASALAWAQPNPGDDLREISQRLKDLASLVDGRRNHVALSTEKATRIREIVTTALRDVHKILGE